MGEINLSQSEKEALARVNLDELDAVIERALKDERLTELYPLRLADCGLYVAKQLDEFQRALVSHGKSKSSKKWEETNERFRRAGGRLSNAVRQMKQRMQEEEEEGRLFRVDDHILYPFRFSPSMSVTVRYQWRKSMDDQWSYGSITFSHIAEIPIDYILPKLKRKPSAAKQREELERKLYDEWEHLVRLSLYSVRDYFRSGGDGAAIPETFRVKVDPYRKNLNNFSADFWRERS